MSARRLVILGATGDLTSRHLVPALVELSREGSLPEDLEVVGVARDDWSTERYRDHLAERLDDASGDAARSLLACVRYVAGDVTDAGVLRAAGVGDGPSIAYLALPPAVFEPAVEALAAAGLGDGDRIVVEKPFGTDLASAERLNARLHAVLAEDAVHRVDHFLGHQTVQNLLGLRFANRVFEPLWNQHHVERVEITWDETLALEGRAGYYDGTGALRDMLQNHLLQLLCLVAMEPPASLSARDLRDRKVEVLRAVRRPGADEVARGSVRGRYEGYADEAGVDPSLGTETFAQVTLQVDTWRWAGVPFVLRSGKALGEDRHEIVVRFRPVPHLAFGQEEEPPPNVLRLTVDPDGVALGVVVNGPGDPFSLEPAELSATLAPQRPGAYARVLLDVLAGDPVLSIRADEAEEAWRIVEPVLEAWQQGLVPLRGYAIGSSGPA